MGLLRCLLCNCGLGELLGLLRCLLSNCDLGRLLGDRDLRRLCLPGSDARGVDLLAHGVCELCPVDALVDKAQQLCLGQVVERREAAEHGGASLGLRPRRGVEPAVVPVADPFLGLLLGLLAAGQVGHGHVLDVFGEGRTLLLHGLSQVQVVDVGPDVHLARDGPQGGGFGARQEHQQLYVDVRKSDCRWIALLELEVRDLRRQFCLSARRFLRLRV